MYTAPITRKQKAAIILLIDQSGSMQEIINFQRSRMSKAEAASYFANLLIEELINRSRRNDGVYDYFDIMVLGYHGEVVESLISDKIEFQPISRLYFKVVASKTHYIERKIPNTDNYVSAAISYKCWVTPKAEDSTPMFTALMQCEKAAKRWSSRPEHRNSFPLLVINITDGEASDSDNMMLLNISERIKSISTADGNTLFFNIHLATSEDSEQIVKFPSLSEKLPENRLTQLLYDMSSTLPDCYNDIISEIKGNLCTPPFKAMCYNCSGEDLIKILSIGSVSLDKTI